MSDEKTVEVETQKTGASFYIVPIQLLAGLTVAGNESDVNERVRSEVQRIIDSPESRSILFETSQRLSKLMEGSSLIVVPDLYKPVTDKEDADVVINFVKDLNDKTSEQREANGADTQLEEPEQPEH